MYVTNKWWPMLKYLKAYIILFSKHELLLININ